MRLPILFEVQSPSDSSVIPTPTSAFGLGVSTVAYTIADCGVNGALEVLADISEREKDRGLSRTQLQFLKGCAKYLSSSHNRLKDFTDDDEGVILDLERVHDTDPVIKSDVGHCLGEVFDSMVRYFDALVASGESRAPSQIYYRN